jgi:hypothetical protein
MKKVWLTALGLVMLTSIIAAAAGPHGPSSITRIEGVITDIDSANQQLIVDTVVVQVTPNTKITMKDAVISFDDLQVGMTVMACGVMEEEILNAHKVNVKYCGN